MPRAEKKKMTPPDWDASPTPSILVGRVYHNISKNNNGKKRPRPWECCDVKCGIEEKNAGPSSSSNFHQGFIFIPEGHHSGSYNGTPAPLSLASYCRSKGNVFPLVIPYPSLRAACHAASTGKLIRISQYSLIRYRDRWGELIYTSRSSERRNASEQVMQSSCVDFVAIEVHHDGLHLDSSEIKEDSEKQSGGNETPSMTLEDLAQNERKNKSSSGGSKSTKKRKEPMNVTGVVDAISPILVNDSSQGEPFAIMELYQAPTDEADTDVKSAVAVIRGEQALCMHPAIHPGQSLTLVGVVSRRWKVPEEFQKHLNDEVAQADKEADKSDLYQRLNHRVPDRVIFVTETSAIRWNDGYELMRCLDNMSLPSTVESLTSIRGVVKSVHYHLSKPKDHRRANPHVAHFVTLKLLLPTKDASLEDRSTLANQILGVEKKVIDDQKLARIYLPKYPMSPNLLLGLQTGSILRAVNIHSIPISEKCEFVKQDNFPLVDAHFQCYVACMRSTVVIERCAGESYHGTRSSHPWFAPRERTFTLVPDHRITDICSDPFNTKSSDTYFAEEKFRCELESKFIDAPSSSYESTDLVEYAQRPFCHDADSHDFKASDEQRSSSHSISNAADELLTHHHRTVILGKSNDVKGESKVCNCVKHCMKARITITETRGKGSNRVNGEKNGRLSMRDPYAEFFDHALSAAHYVECGSSCNEFSSYNHFHHFSSIRMPRVVRLEDLRNACAQNFIKRVVIYLQSKLQLASSDIDVGHECRDDIARISSGWTSSHHYNGLTLCQVLNDYAQSQSRNNAQSKALYNISNDSMNNYTRGSVELNNLVPNSDPATASLRNNACTIPFCELRNEPLQAYQPENSGLPTWMQIGSVIVSCLCLGPIRKDYAPESSEDTNSSRHVSPHSFLPSMLSGDTKSADTDGHEFVFLVDNLVFIASVQITAKSIVSTDQSNNLRVNAGALRALHKPRETNEPRSSRTERTGVLSVHECLEQSTSDGHHEIPVSIVGRLVRQRFTFRKLKPVHRDGGCEKCYGGWTVVLSHIEPSSGNLLDVSSVLQTIEVRISIPFGKSTQVRTDALIFSVRKLFTSSSKYIKIITPDQVTMGLAWLTVSEDGRTLPVLSGGWDECNDKNNIFHQSVRLEIPYISRSFSKLGYQRFRCNFDDMKSFYVEHRSSQGLLSETSHSASTSAELNFSGKGKFLPGMLTRRLRRLPPLVFNVGKKEPVYLRRNRHSLLTRMKCQTGVPSATLAELHCDICTALKEGDHKHLKPSLLRRIHTAKILGGLSFCRARVECTQCFKAFTSGVSSKNADPSAAAHRHPGSHSKSSPTGAEKNASILFCPSGCSRSHGAVKWECSVIIDDGTGQAKMYAEREAALLLLGDSLDVSVVEEGAWELGDGLFFQPALPASSHLMQCIKDASTQARKYILDNKLNKKEKSRIKDLPSTFSLLPTTAKAEYLLQQHCRQWYQTYHSRKMDLFCRCKPLSEDVTSVNQSVIQVAKAWIANVGLDFVTAPTASLPPLKLTMEDACLASEDSYDDDISGWNLLRSYNNDV